MFIGEALSHRSRRALSGDETGSDRLARRALPNGAGIGRGAALKRCRTARA